MDMIYHTMMYAKSYKSDNGNITLLFLFNE